MGQSELVIYMTSGSSHGSVKSVALHPPPKGSCTTRRGESVTIIMDIEIGELINFIIFSLLIISKINQCLSYRAILFVYLEYDYAKRGSLYDMQWLPL